VLLIIFIVAFKVEYACPADTWEHVPTASPRLWFMSVTSMRLVHLPVLKTWLDVWQSNKRKIGKRSQEKQAETGKVKRRN